MYKNFKLTEKEKREILEQHKSHGYKKPLNEENLEEFYGKFESGYFSDGMYRESGGFSLVGLDTNSNHIYSSLKWLDDAGYEKKTYDTVDELFDAVPSVGKAFSYRPKEEQKRAAQEVKKLMGDQPFIVWKAPRIITVFRKQPIDKTINESFWDSIFGKPSVDDAAKTQLKGQGYSHRGKEESGENYLVFNGEKFYPEQIVYADYHDLGKLPRVENGKLIIKNPAWEL